MLGRSSTDMLVSRLWSSCCVIVEYVDVQSFTFLRVNTAQKNMYFDLLF